MKAASQSSQVPTLAEKLDKIKSPGLQSQQKTALVLQAVESTLKGKSTSPNPTEYFAALVPLLQQANSNGSINPELAVPAVYLLDVVTPYVPQSLLRSKFTPTLNLLAPVLQMQAPEPLLLRTCIGCLESLLLAQDGPSWEMSVTQMGPRRAVVGLLNLALDHRPKVRRRAQEALSKVLQNPPPSPSLDHPAADMCAQTALKNLEHLAAQVTRAAKKPSAVTNDAALLHVLQLVKCIAAASGGWPSLKIECLCELLLGIAKTGNEYMTMASFEIFEMIFETMSDEVSSVKLTRLMGIMAELRPAANDTQLVPPWLAILSRGYGVSSQVEPQETFHSLPELFALVSQFLESHSDNIRISASECLMSFMANCIPQQVIVEPSVYDEKVLDKMASKVETLLTVQYQSAWLETFKVTGAMFTALRWASYPRMLNITRTMGEIRENRSFQHKKEADEVIGQAVQAMGPEAVLSALPLNIIKPAKGQSGRAWMFPILRDYTSNTCLAHFRKDLVPLSQLMFQKVLDHGESDKTMEIKIYETLVQQIWSILPGYCDLPLDLPDAFDLPFAELLANLLYKQVDLRLDICKALKMLIESNQAMASIQDGEEDFLLQRRVSREAARANLAYLGQFCANMLAVLFNVYTQTLPQTRGPILQTINAFLSITPEGEMVETFDRVCKMLASELQNGEASANEKQHKSKDHMPSTCQTLMDLIITMSVYLPRENFAALFEIATVVIAREKEPQLQKKAYKLLPRLASSELGRAALQERNAQMQQLVLSSASKVSAPARRDRLAAMQALVPLLPDTALHFVPSVLSEVVICCKENNERARETAYELLVQMGHRMASAGDAPIDNSRVPHMPRDAPPARANLEEYMTMVSAGLAGSTPHMISASITALSRLLFEFRSTLSQQTLSDLVQTMDLFLTSNNREIVKSCLGFVKVCVISLPVDLVLARLPTLVPNIIAWSHEHKGHFKSKVKHILERMVRRFGFDLVSSHCPESDRKLMVNIRKTKERAKRNKDKMARPDRDSDDGHDDAAMRRFDNEYDEALYSSDSEAADAAAPTKPKPKRGSTYIIEDADEPLDLLDKRALANVSSTKPAKLHRPAKSKAKFDPDGKLILGHDDDAMDLDQPDAQPSGVGAYVAALQGRDAARRGRGGKLKFSNRRTKDAPDDDDGAVLDQAVPMARTRGALVSKGLQGAERGGQRPRRNAGLRAAPRDGRGGIARGRRGLGVEKKPGSRVAAGGVAKARRGRR
ncbi:hypothetical protein CDD81_2426 [Ophiocordyceps australis]|uniref:Uncharacterized protein n=1 Tax=Ophiocordyceps australis TaxID=1399860 RepID=A0A2C5XWT0_9HYPO|nr:hypothetical protein CDD81_2426 [Ophiocordyceps australis]